MYGAIPKSVAAFHSYLRARAARDGAARLLAGFRGAERELVTDPNAPVTLRGEDAFRVANVPRVGLPGRLVPPAFSIIVSRDRFEAPLRATDLTFELSLAF